MQLNELRKELRFNQELLSLVETLKNVAGSQFHLLEKKKQRFEAFMEAFSEFFRVVDLVDVENPFVKTLSDTTGVIFLTSDSGFMGGLNAGVLRAGMEAVQDVAQEKVSYVMIGEKGAGALGDQGVPFKFFGGIGQDTIYEQAVVIKDYLMEEVREGRMGRVLVACPRALSFSSQTIEVVQLLPCGTLFEHDPAAASLRESTPDVVPTLRGAKRLLSEARKVIVESSYDHIAEYLSGVWVTSKLFELFEDGKLAEFGARAMHLEGSLQKVEKEYTKTKQKCFKATHELVDKGMRESFAAKATKKRKRRKDVEAV